MKSWERTPMRIEEMIDRCVYDIRARNFLAGVWDAEASGFIGIREKFHSLFLFTEYWHEPPSGVSTARAFALLGKIPDDIVLAEYLPSLCADCGKEVVHIQYTRENPRGDQKGFQHADGTPMEDTRQGSYGVVSQSNPRLFNALVPYAQAMTDAYVAEMAADGFPDEKRFIWPLWEDRETR